MNRWRAWFAVLIFPLSGGSAGVRADEFEDLRLDTRSTYVGQVSMENSNWQVGVGLGYAFVQNAPTIHQTTTNIFAYGVSDNEVVATTEGKLHNSVDIGLNVYRRLTPLWWAGVEMDYQVSHKVDAVMTNNPSLSSEFQSFGVTTEVTSHETIAEIIPCLKLSTHWPGQSQLYAVAGAGWASVNLSNTIHYIFDLGNGSTFEFQGDQGDRKDYLATKLGGGMDYNLWDDGSLGLDVRYNVIFTSDKPLKMIIPSLHFDYHF